MAGNAQIGALRVVLGIDSAQLEEGVNRAKRKMSELGEFKLGNGLVTGIKGIEEGFKDLAGEAGLAGRALSSMGGIGLAVGAGIGVATAAVVELFKAAREAVDVAAEFGKLAKTVGVSTDFIQQFNYAARQSDIDVGAADEALKALNATVGAVQGNLPRAQKLAVVFAQALKITPDQLRSYKDVGDLLPVLADRIREAGSAAEQAAIAKKFGVEALLPMLRQGGAAFSELAQKARDLGIVMDGALIEKAESAKHKLSEISDVMHAKANIEFAQLSGTLVTIESGFLKAEVAALKFLAAITGTTPLTDKFFGFQKLAGVPLLGGIYKDKAGEVLSKILKEGLGAKEGGEGADGAARQLIGDKNAGKVAEASDEAVARAKKDQLTAELALTADLDRRLAIQLETIETERRAANRKLAEEASQGKITAAAAGRAAALNNLAARDKAALAVRDADDKAEEALLGHKREVDRFYERIAQIQSRAAQTAEARFAIDKANLDATQKLDREELERKIKLDRTLSESGAAELRASQRDEQAAEQEALAREHRLGVLEETTERARSALQSQIEIDESAAELLKSGFAQAQAETKILDEKHKLAELALEEEIQQAEINKAGAERLAELRRELAALKEVHANEDKAAHAATNLFRGLTEAADAFGSLKDAVARHDWGGIFDQMQRVVETVTAALSQMAGSGGGSGQVGGFTSTLASLAKSAASVLPFALAVEQLASSGAGAVTGLLGGSKYQQKVASNVGSFTGIIPGAIAGLLTHESNYGAIETFNGIAGATLSGDKRNGTTTGLATSTSTAILQGEQLLGAFGITLKTTIEKIDIGTRDMTHILTSTGQEIRSAVGDPAAAAEAALKAVLQGAQFTDQAQKALVDSMIAAGKGFDDIAAALANYKAAQDSLGAIGDQILQLKDPQAFDTKRVKDAIAAARSAEQAAADQGLITAEQLAQVNAQLDTLQGLQLDQVLARYANSAAAAADTVDAARQKLSASVEAAAQADQDQINLYQQIADSLTAYLDQLREQSLAAGPGTLGAASSLFGQTAALAQAGDAVAGGKLQGVAEAFRTANAGQAKSAVELARNEALIRIGVEKAAETAKREVSVAEQQLEELHTQTDALLEIDRSVLSVVDAIEALNLALTEQAAGATGAPPITTAVPAAPPSVTTLDSTSPPITPATAIDPATIAPSLNGADVAASLMRQSSLLEQVAIASGVTAATLKFFNRVGMPDVRPA